MQTPSPTFTTEKKEKHIRHSKYIQPSQPTLYLLAHTQLKSSQLRRTCYCLDLSLPPKMRNRAEEKMHSDQGCVAGERESVQQIVNTIESAINKHTRVSTTCINVHVTQRLPSLEAHDNAQSMHTSGHAHICRHRHDAAPCEQT